MSKTRTDYPCETAAPSPTKLVSITAVLPAPTQKDSSTPCPPTPNEQPARPPNRPRSVLQAVSINIRKQESPRVCGGLPGVLNLHEGVLQAAPCTRGFTIGHEKPHRHSTNAQRRGSRLRSREHRSPRVRGSLPCHHRPTHNPHRSPRIYGVLPTNSQPGFKAKRIAPCMRGFTNNNPKPPPKRSNSNMKNRTVVVRMLNSEQDSQCHRTRQKPRRP